MKNYVRASTDLGLEALIAIFNALYEATDMASLKSEKSHAGVRIAVTDSTSRPPANKMGPWLYNAKEKALERLKSECVKIGYVHITTE